jgi:hypothetical protein
MTNINDNIPKTETIYEIKNETQSVVGDQIPSFEEFMKAYKVDQVVEEGYWLENQAQIRGYGPCEYSECPYDTRFYLEIGFGGGRIRFAEEDDRGDRTIFW